MGVLNVKEGELEVSTSAGLIGSSYKACSFDQFSTPLAGISLI